MSLPDSLQPVSTAKRLQTAKRVVIVGLAVTLTVVVPTLGTPILVGLAAWPLIKRGSLSETAKDEDPQEISSDTHQEAAVDRATVRPTDEQTS